MAGGRASRPHALLLAGPPGVGKTTLVRRVAQGLAGRRLRGFITDEIRERGGRVGFRLETLDRRSTVLAHVGNRSRHRVGRYGVDIAALDGLAASALALDEATEVYLVDEIGKMECLSARFVAAVRALLDAGRPLVATIAVRGAGLIEEAKGHPNAELWSVTRQNRDRVPARVLAWLAGAQDGSTRSGDGGTGSAQQP